MQKSIFLFVFIGFFIQINCEDSCGSPIECYSQAIQNLQQDRIEIRSAIESSYKNLENVKKNMNDKIEAFKIEMQKEFVKNSKSVESLKQKLAEETNNLNIRLKNLKAVPSNCKWIEEPQHTGWNQALCPNGYYATGAGHFTMPHDVDDERIRVYCCQMNIA